MSKLLFVLKHREQPWGHYGYHLSSGLRNSVRFVVDMLNMMGIEAKWIEVIDNNRIDREVKHYQPTHVIIEAFWVVPEKFDILKKLHPNVTWMVRDHSETPFIANEGVAMGWIAGYLKRGVQITCNAPRAVVDMETIALGYGHPEAVSYTPNYYPVHNPSDYRHLTPHRPRADNTIRVGCFGAIRPLKNHLTQAVAAIRYGQLSGKKLEFYVNTHRIEQGGNPVLKNLKELFASTPRAKLVEVPWMDHDRFLDLLYTIDISLQVSFSETFNIVAADSVACGVPVIASREVSWLGQYGVADPNSSTDIVRQMMSLNYGNLQQRLLWQFRDLTAFCNESKNVWWERFGSGFRGKF